MLRILKSLNGRRVDATDGEIGKIVDCLFDEERWAVRYLAVDTGSWWTLDRALVSPYAVETPVGEEPVRVRLTREQIRNSPPLPGQVIPRRYETDYAAYYGYPQYWMGPSLWGAGAYPAIPPPHAGGPQGPAPMGGPAAEPGPESHIKSARAIAGYHIHAADGEIGHVDDLFTDVRSWEIRYLLVDTSNWIGGKPVLVSPQWARRIDWLELLIYVDLPRDQIRSSPEFDPSRPLTSDDERRLAEHYRGVDRR